MKIADMRSQAKALGLRGYSRMTKAELEKALTTRVVYREDRALVDLLGEQSLRACRVAEWVEKGRGRFRKTFPRAWHVPVGLLEGHTPPQQDRGGRPPPQTIGGGAEGRGDRPTARGGGG